MEQVEWVIPAMVTMRLEVAPTHMEEFTSCVAEYRQLVDELRIIEERMTETLERMRMEDAPRERLLVASSVLADVREVLSCSM